MAAQAAGFGVPLKPSPADDGFARAASPWRISENPRLFPCVNLAALRH
jgi:hypothetical protein